MAKTSKSKPQPHAKPAAMAFAFTPQNLSRVEEIIARYPAGRQQSAVMPLLMLAQRQNENWLPRAAMDAVAVILGMPPVRVYEVASFYTMYNLEPVGKHVVQVCTTTPCWLRGSNDIVEACEKRLGIKIGGTTKDGQFTLKEAECLGACVNAPMCAIGDHFYEDLTPQSMTQLLDAFAQGMQPEPGPQSERKSSEPAMGLTTLKEGK
jgi:NADH dehydrogenase (ubiquinone) flavoprotein 2